MKELFRLSVFVCVFSSFSFGQGTLKGKVTEENGEVIGDVKIFVKDNKQIVTRTDFEGNFSLVIPLEGMQKLIFYTPGFDTLVESFEFKNNEVIVSDFTMLPFKLEKEVGEAKIVARTNKKKENYVQKLKINSATSIDFISNQQMKEIGDPNAVSAISRVSGVSTTGGLITVRGIGDRYVKTMLNGSRIPTLDPLTNNIKLDIFPASLIDNIILSKTASPDLPGDWSGAYISIETKDYPTKLDVNVESQFGYNAQTTFKEVISSQRSSTDWLGYDNGFRNVNLNSVENPVLNPTQYQEMAALGLTDYYKNMGVSGWTAGSAEGNTYFKLGLVELGLLPKALINDNAAYTNALAVYNSTYKDKAFNTINPEGKDYNNGLSNSWGTVTRKAPLNFTQSFSIGEELKLFGKPFGYVVGFRYGTSTRFDPHGVSQRVGAEELNFPFDVIDDVLISRETNGWNALLNLAYTVNENTKISFLYMPNYMGTNDVAKFTTPFDNNPGLDSRTQNNIFYEQREQQVFQFNANQFLPKHKIKIDFNSSYTLGSSIAPDFKILQYDFFYDNEGNKTDFLFGATAGDGIRRYYRYLKEDLFDSKISVEIPLNSKQKLARKFKFGGAYQNLDRKSDLNEYYLDPGNNLVMPQLTNDDIDAYLDPSNFIMKDQVVNFTYTARNAARNHSFGVSSISACFGMIDYEISKELRVSGGLRVENARIFTDIVEFHNLGFERNHVKRENLGGFARLNAADINETNFLPSVNVIYKWDIIDSAQTNLRLNFSQTVARPSIRELNDAAVFDNEFRTLIYGNSDLKFVEIQNYDFRAESFLKNNDNVSISLFYKDFKNHIEMGFGSAGITWQNIDQSSVKGIELEGRKGFGKKLEIRGNVTLVKSVSQFIRKDLQIVDGEKVITPLDTVYRAMFGQAPYLVNASITFKPKKTGIHATLSYNVQGPRLVITGIVKGRPDVYEMPRNTVDFKISKKLGKKFSASLNVRDILNAPVRRAYKLPSEWVDYDRFRYGTNYTVALSFNL
jgi:hypothetical protein